MCWSRDVSFAVAIAHVMNRSYLGNSKYSFMVVKLKRFYGTSHDACLDAPRRHIVERIFQFASARCHSQTFVLVNDIIILLIRGSVFF